MDCQAGKKLRKGKRKHLRKTALRRALWAGVRSPKKVPAEKVDPLLEAAAGDETPLGGDLLEAPATPEPVPEAVVEVEAPATPEPVPEPPEAVPWPKAGVRVAVGVENLAHYLRLGETGVSEGLLPMLLLR